MDLGGDIGKVGLLLIFALFVSVFTSIFVIAQDNNSNTGLDDGLDSSEASDIDEEKDEELIEDFDDEFSDAELQSSAGITPDSAFYFVEDSILSKFRDELENKEKKIAEIRAMIQQGKIDEARIALQRYEEYADALEKEIDPEKRDEARRSAAAIRNAINEIESEISDEDKEDFVDNVLEKERSIVTAVEIASKIKDLCEQLSGLDPLEYSRICNTDQGSPEWQIKLDRELTKEQASEARAFGEIMSQCFKTEGRECRCEDISIKPFADRCSVVAPLAAACDNGDESACEAMDDATEGMEDLLPDYLLDVMMDVERKFGEDQFDLHMPRECREEGATTPQQCMEVMFRLNAPEECIEAFERGEIDFSNERQARQACEEIMFKENAPEECINAGLKDPRECGKLMFQLNAPEECIDAGLTGESRSDERRCREIMNNLRGEEGSRGGFNPDCRRIENSEERLKCYDGATGGIQQHYEQRGPSGGFPPQCEEAGAVTRESCEKIMRQWGDQQRQDFDQRYGETKERERQCAESCSREGGAWSFINGQCDCRVDQQRDYGEFREFREQPPQEFQQPPEGFVPPEGFNPEQPPQPGTELSPSTTSPSTETSGEQTTESPTTESSPVTGAVISSGDRFSYYFWN